MIIRTMDWKRFCAVYILSVISVLSGCSESNTHQDPNASNQDHRVDYFVDNGFSTPVDTLQHPAGEHYNGITYVAYQGPLEDPYIASYNHETAIWNGPFKAGISDMGKDPKRKKVDNHGKPAIIIDDAGYIHVAFGGHGGVKALGENKLGSYNYGRQQHVVSTRPYDITEFRSVPDDNVSMFGSYSQWVKMDNGDLYLFYRHGSHRSDWVYQRSTDNGHTFSDAVSVLKSKRRDEVLAEDAWYAWFTKGPKNQIAASVTYHLCSDRTDAQNHVGERKNGYYIAMDTSDHIWRNIGGDALVTPLTKEGADLNAVVMDSGEEWTDRGTVKLDADGNPHVTYRMGPHQNKRLGGPKTLFHYRWDGQKWLGGSKVLPVAIGDFNVSSAKDIEMILLEQGDVVKWVSDDGGRTFKRDGTLLSSQGASFAISSIIRNAHPEAKVIVAEKFPGKPEYGRVYLLGDNGPIRRPQIDANIANK